MTMACRPESGPTISGHTSVSMTQDRYMTHGRIHTQVADLLDRTVTKSGE